MECKWNRCGIEIIQNENRIKTEQKQNINRIKIKQIQIEMKWIKNRTYIEWNK